MELKKEFVKNCRKIGALEQYLSDYIADAFEKDLAQTLHDRMQQRIKWQACLINETIETRKNKCTYKGEFTTAVILANAYNNIFENQYKDFDVKEGESKWTSKKSQQKRI